MNLVIPNLPVLTVGEHEALRQIADNLVSNAIKFTPKSGKIDVTVKEENGKAVLEVSDTGIGIKPEDQDRIFERFYRVDKARSRELGGTGLGLSIVKHITQTLGGKVYLKSMLGTGSTFRVELPLA